MSTGAWVGVIAFVLFTIVLAPFLLSMAIDLAKAWHHVVIEELPEQWRKR